MKLLLSFVLSPEHWDQDSDARRPIRCLLRASPCFRVVRAQERTVSDQWRQETHTHTHNKAKGTLKGSLRKFGKAQIMRSHLFWEAENAPWGRTVGVKTESRSGGRGTFTQKEHYVHECWQQIKSSELFFVFLSQQFQNHLKQWLKAVSKLRITKLSSTKTTSRFSTQGTY